MIVPIPSKSHLRDVASGVKFPAEAFIDGKYAPSVSGETIACVNPADGEKLFDVSSCDQADLDYAVDKAQAVFDRGDWSGLHPSERKAVMLKLVELIKRDFEEIALLESLEAGKSIRDCYELDLPETIHCMEWFAEGADKLYDQISPSGGGAIGMLRREPLPVVSCVIPWNFPLLTLAWKIGPALALGSSIIVKPSEHSNASALKIGELAVEAGVPAGVLNILPGFGASLGRAIGLHNGISVVSFTGSTQTGRQFLRYSSESNLKKIVLECGGKSPAVVLKDAGDLEIVASFVAQGAFLNAGQNCTANTRLIVLESMKEAVLEKVVEQAKLWKAGDPLDPDNRIGAIISEQQYNKINQYIETGEKEGGRVVYRGEFSEKGNGWFVSPTIIDNVDSKSTVAQEEIFGPVLSVITVQDDDEAIKVANDSQYGLQASVYTRDVAKAHKAAAKLQAGTVTINSYGEGDVATPFGGFKMSGFGGHDKSVLAYDQYSQIKTIWTDLS